MRVVIVDELLGQADEDDELGDHCDRCGRPVSDDYGALAVVTFLTIGTAEWYWCDDCADSFTAWRLAVDREPTGLSGEPWPPAGPGTSPGQLQTQANKEEDDDNAGTS